MDKEEIKRNIDRLQKQYFDECPSFWTCWIWFMIALISVFFDNVIFTLGFVIVWGWYCVKRMFCTVQQPYVKYIIDSYKFLYESDENKEGEQENVDEKKSSDQKH